MFCCVMIICVYISLSFSFLCSVLFFFFKHKTAYELRISDWSSDVCSSDLAVQLLRCHRWPARQRARQPIQDRLSQRSAVHPGGLQNRRSTQDRKSVV